MSSIMDDMENAVDRTNKRLMAEIIQPFCDRYNLNYITGMGTYFFTNHRGTQIHTDRYQNIVYCTPHSFSSVYQKARTKAHTTFIDRLLDVDNTISELMDDYKISGWNYQANTVPR